MSDSRPDTTPSVNVRCVLEVLFTRCPVAAARCPTRVLERAIERVNADRGCGEHGVERDLRELRVRFAAIPTKGEHNAEGRQVTHYALITTLNRPGIRGGSGVPRVSRGQLA
jgi:hypothetical protein